MPANRARRETINLEQGWGILQKGITKLKNNLEGLPGPRFNSDDYMLLYTTVYNMCVQSPPHNYSQQLYDKYIETIREYITSTVLPSLREKHDEIMLRELVKRWLNHKYMVRRLSHLFDYLGRHFIKAKELVPLLEVGLTCFRHLVYSEIKGKIRDALICLIYQEREGEGEQIDWSFVNNALDIYVEIEADFREDKATCYRKSSNWILNDSYLDYNLKVEEFLKREKDRAAQYPFFCSEKSLRTKLQRDVLFVYASQLLKEEHSGCHAVLLGNEAEKRNVVDLQEQVCIRKLIELHDKYVVPVNDCFQHHSLFCKALTEAFEVFCNKGVTAGRSNAELLASFCDNILRKDGSEKLDSEAIEETLQKVSKLLSFIHDKNAFAEFFREKLTRRLLFDVSDYDHERNFLTMIKQHCAKQFTSKMERMITELTIARANEANFKDYLKFNPNANPGLDLTVTVLKTGLWPSYCSSDLNLPTEMGKCVQVFGEFYRTHNKDRKLVWIYSLGTCSVSGEFESKTIELIVTPYQAATLLLFNAADRLSYTEIRAQLNIPDDLAVRLLYSLSGAKYKILNKEPQTKFISTNHVFEFNSKFTDRKTRIQIKIPHPSSCHQPVIDNVVRDRRYAIDACIMRIMKARKVLGHQQLIDVCVKQLGRLFKPDPILIKKRIADLVSRDYLERNKDNPKLLRYLP